MVPAGTAGVALTSVSVTVYLNVGSTRAEYFFERMVGNTRTSIGSNFTTSFTGWQSLPISLTENTSGRGYSLQLQFTDPNAGTAMYSGIAMQYAMSDPKQAA